jgi:superfamily II DNA or RNA helicase
MQLRPYQEKFNADIYKAWENAQNVLAVAATGSGKTVSFSSILQAERGPSLAVVHRDHLVAQISMSLAKFGVNHRLYAGLPTVKWIASIQAKEFGRTFIDPTASCTVAGVDKLYSDWKDIKPWLQSIRRCVWDEAHHVQADNKWGKVASGMINAENLGVTATPVRTDGGGLGRACGDGIFDIIVESALMRWLIDHPENYLADYRVICKDSDINIEAINISKSTGEYVQKGDKGLIAAVRRSHIVGDVVKEYMEYAEGKRGATFATDLDTAEDLAAAYIKAGIPAVTMSYKTKGPERYNHIKDFIDGKLLQIVNVDLFGEGFDVPALEVVSMARPTQSYNVFGQQFGRPLRPKPDGGKGIILDHVGNVLRHGLPDKPKVWTLDRRAGQPKSKGPSDYKVCPLCHEPYERIYPVCPHCRKKPPIANRSGPQFVDGDLTELSPEVLRALRSGKDQIDKDVDLIRDKAMMATFDQRKADSAAKHHLRKQTAQASLREAMGIFGALHRREGNPDAMSYRVFYHRYGIDILSAQGLDRAKAEALEKKVRSDFNNGGWRG